MKKKIYILAVSVLTTVCLFAGTVKTKGTLGAPSKDCKGMGVCKSTTTTEGASADLTMSWTLSEDHQSIQLHIPIEELEEIQPEQAMAFEGLDEVDFTDPTVLPDEVASEFGLEYGYTIPAGLFQLLRSGDEYIIVFPLQ